MKTFKIAALLFVLAAGVFACDDNDLNEFKVDQVPTTAAPANGGGGDSSGDGGSTDCPDC